MRTNNPAAFDVAQVNHYALRSVDSFLIKRDRGRANHMSHTIGEKYWRRHNLGGVLDDSISQYDGASGDWRDRLQEWPELMALHDKAVAWHLEKASMLRRSEDQQPLIDFVMRSFEA